MQTSLVYGALDVGLDQLAIHFGQSGAKLRKVTGITTDVVEHVDHALFSSAAREAVFSRCEQFVRERIIRVPLHAAAQTKSTKPRRGQPQGDAENHLAHP